MRTTLEIPDTLIKEAMIATQIKTKNKVVKLALEELIKKSKISELKQFQGKIDLDLDLDVLRNRGWNSCWHIRLDRLFQEWKIFWQVEPAHRFASYCSQRFNSHRVDPFFDCQEKYQSHIVTQGSSQNSFTNQLGINYWDANRMFKRRDKRYWNFGFNHCSKCKTKRCCRVFFG